MYSCCWKKRTLRTRSAATRPAARLAAAPREVQSGVSDVHFVRKHGDSHRLHFRNRLLYDGEQDVEVVDHQVVDHVDIEAARREHSQPVHLEKERMIQNGLD